MINDVTRNVLGVPIRFITEHSEIDDVLCAMYGENSEQNGDAEFTIRIKLLNSTPRELNCPPQYTLKNNSLEGQSGSSYFHADRTTSQADIFLCKAMLMNEYLLRYQMLNAVCFYLLSYRLFLPIHATCFVMGEYRVFCFGRSGMGKSTLAMAALQRGYSVLSEDLCFVGNRSSVGIKFDCREFHLYADSHRRFFEPEQYKISTTHNGKKKYIVPNHSIDQIDKANNHSNLLLFLEPKHHQAETKLTPCLDYSNFDDLLNPKEAGFDLNCKVRSAAVNWLKEQPSYQGQLGYDLNNFFSEVQEIEEYLE